MTLYHGSPVLDCKELKCSLDGEEGPGIYLTDDKQLATDFAAGMGREEYSSQTGQVYEINIPLHSVFSLTNEVEVEKFIEWIVEKYPIVSLDKRFLFLSLNSRLVLDKQWRIVKLGKQIEQFLISQGYEINEIENLAEEIQSYINSFKVWSFLDSNKRKSRIFVYRSEGLSF